MFGYKQDATAQLNLGQLTNLKKKKEKKQSLSQFWWQMDCQVKFLSPQNISGNVVKNNFPKKN